MSTTTTELIHHRNAFDDWRSLGISLYMTLVGYGVLVGIPVISTAWTTQLGFSEVEVGRVAGADLGGLSLGAVVAAFFISRMNRRVMVLASALVAIAANYLQIAERSALQRNSLRELALNETCAADLTADADIASRHRDAAKAAFARLGMRNNGISA